MRLPCWDLRCACRFRDGRPPPALTVAEAAAILREHRCGAPLGAAVMVPRASYRGPRELAEAAGVR